MALQHKISDSITSELLETDEKIPVLEINFRYIKYRLVFDDRIKGLKILELIKKATEIPVADRKAPPQMPKFYKKP